MAIGSRAFRRTRLLPTFFLQTPLKKGRNLKTGCRAAMAEMTTDSECELAAAVIVLWGPEKKKKKRKRKEWMKPWLQRRPDSGAYECLMHDLVGEDVAGCRNYMRMDIDEFQYLLQLVDADISVQTTFMRQSIPSRERLAVTLRYLATGESFSSLQYQFRISKSTLSIVVPIVCEAIFQRLRGAYLKTPNTETEWEAIAKGFAERWDFPNCVGALDGKHVRLRKPDASGSYYYNYEQFCSIVMLALVDANSRFTYVHVGTNARTSDGGVFRWSSLAVALANGGLNLPAPRPLPQTTTAAPFVIVADDAFPDKEYLLKSIKKQALTANEEIFNYRLSRARQCVDHAFGIMASRMRIFHSGIALKPLTVEKIVLACCALHNFLLTRHGLPDVSRVDRTFEPAPFGQMDNLEGSNYSHVAATVTEVYLKYFNGVGSLPWQDEVATGRTRMQSWLAQ